MCYRILRSIDKGGQDDNTLRFRMFLFIDSLVVFAQWAGALSCVWLLHIASMSITDLQSRYWVLLINWLHEHSKSEGKKTSCYNDTEDVPFILSKGWTLGFWLLPFFVTFDSAHMFLKTMMHCCLSRYKKIENKYRLIRNWTIVVSMYQKSLFQSIDATVKKRRWYLSFARMYIDRQIGQFCLIDRQIGQFCLKITFFGRNWEVFLQTAYFQQFVFAKALIFERVVWENDNITIRKIYTHFSLIWKKPRLGYHL